MRTLKNDGLGDVLEMLKTHLFDDGTHGKNGRMV